MKKLFFAFAAVLFLLVSSGCTAAKNIENSKRLRVGMTKAQVLEVMGRPIEDEAYCKPDVWFYFIETVWADGLTTRDECMPLVFENGKLIGWGNSFYTRHSTFGVRRNAAELKAAQKEAAAKKAAKKPAKKGDKKDAKKAPAPKPAKKSGTAAVSDANSKK